MRNLKETGGFALIEVIIIFMVVGVIIVGFGFIGGVLRGNFWVGEASALKAIQRVDSGMTELVTLERHVWGYSKATVRGKDGKEHQFAIDANVLQNRSAKPWN